MAANGSAERSARSGDFPYFRSLWNTVVVSLLTAAFLPLLVLGGVVYVYTSEVLKNDAANALRIQAADHRDMIDQFLSERTADLKALAGSLGFRQLTEPGGIERAFRSLREGVPCFTDLGVIDGEGHHRAYAGPFDLMERNYREQAWFAPALETGVYISDVYLGYRQIPHVIIAVGQPDADGAWVLRATLDADFFDRFVSRSAGELKMDAYLIDCKGIFQTRPQTAGDVMEQSRYREPPRFEEVRIEDHGARIVAMAWLKGVPWLSVVEVKRTDVYASFQRVRWIVLLIFVLGVFLIVPTVLLTTNQMVLRLEAKRTSLQFLDRQLQQASKMASAGRLSQGALEEITDSLANIHAASQWLRVLAGRPPEGSVDPEEVRGTLEQIDAEIHRSEKAVKQGLDLARPSEGPACIDFDIQVLIAELLELMRRELHFKRIRVNREADTAAATVCSDPEDLRQVLQNLITNAVAATPEGGTIEIRTDRTENRLCVTVVDSGPGIPERDLAKIFEPLYTTKPDGLGLGLTISRTILDRLGGTLTVKNEPGQGAAFTVELPLK
ncbi:MAG: ATP-binding protein [Desulfobacterales bacterium]